MPIYPDETARLPQASPAETRAAAKVRDFARDATVTITNRDGFPTRFQGVDIAKGQTVQFGPTRRKPGDLAKRGKT